jgi:hypothetical protein
MPLTLDEQAALDERFQALEDRNAKLERLIRSGKAFTNNPLALATDLDDLGSVKTHLDFEEPTLTPINPLADVVRLYAVDGSGATRLVTRNDNGVGTTRKLPMNVLSAPGISLSGGNVPGFTDASTTSLRMSMPVPPDWVSGTDITLKILVYKTGTGTETAVMKSWISSLADGETWSHNIESAQAINQSIPASSELHTISRTISSAELATGDVLHWLVNREGGSGSDTLNEVLWLRFGPWIEYTAFL